MGDQSVHNLRIQSVETTQLSLKREEAWRLLANFEVDRRGPRAVKSSDKSVWSGTTVSFEARNQFK